MTKEDALNMVKLLSAVESWAFSSKAMLPDYLHEDLCVAIKKLETIVLTEDTSFLTKDTSFLTKDTRLETKDTSFLTKDTRKKLETVFVKKDTKNASI